MPLLIDSITKTENLVLSGTHDVDLTLGDLIDNIELNGYVQAYGKLMNRKIGSIAIMSKNDIESACAIGQGMLNLNLQELAPFYVQDGPLFARFISFVAKLNDNDRMIPSIIAPLAREAFKEYLNMPLKGYSFNVHVIAQGSLR